MLMMLKFKIIFIFLSLFLTNINSTHLRDPFSFQSNHSEQINVTISGNTNEIKILAITESNEKKGAILQKLEEQEVVFLGDSVWGYCVKDITLNSVQLLSTDKKVINLLFES